MNRIHRTLCVLIALSAAVAIVPVVARASASATDGNHGDYSLCLGGACHDPLRDGRPTPAGWSLSDRDAEPCLHLLQLNGPTEDQTLDALNGCGIEVLQYIHPFTYLVVAEPVSLHCAHDLEQTRWSGPLQPADKVLTRWRGLDIGLVRTRILSYRADRADHELLSALLRLGGTVRAQAPLPGPWQLTVADLPGTAFQAVAHLPLVLTLQPMPTDGGDRTELGAQVVAGNIDVNGTAVIGYGSWLAGLGLDGSGVTMANVDSGIDQSHPDLVARIVDCTGDTCGADRLSSHGTHTAGIMAGDGSSATTNAAGFLRGLGVAPGANLVEQVYSPTYTQPGGMLTLMTDSVRNGAIMSSNSWGPAGTPRGYDLDTRLVDIGVRDADPDLTGHQPLLYVLSIMNGYGGVSTQGTPDEAKNILTVGSTALQDFSGNQVDDLGNLSTNSGHGPALDGRIIPHLVAPGCYVDSTTPSDTWGLKCGTSMASPHVSGGAALYVEQRRNAGLPDPSPAMVKAALLAAATNLTGQLDADGQPMGPPFETHQGWGRLHLQDVLATDQMIFDLDQTVRLDVTGENWSEVLTVAEPAQPVRIMLAWTDAPGHGLGGITPAWCNDLDLEVATSDGTEYVGNSFDGDGWSIPGGDRDVANNTEGVFLPAGLTTAVRIRVAARNLAADGVPGVGDSTDQDFALIGRNLVPCTSPPQFEGLQSLDSSTAPTPAFMKLKWEHGTAGCGGELTYRVFSDQGGGTIDWSTPIVETSQTSKVVNGIAPDVSICFGVRALELGRSDLNEVELCGTSSGLRLAGDANCDGTVTTSDLVRTVATIFGAPDCGIGLLAADADLSGEVNAGDLSWQLDPARRRTGR